MQIFEAVELKEFPYMETIEIVMGGETVGDIISEEKVYLLVDHDLKRIWTYNGLKSPFKLQLYGGILAGEMRKQLKLFYRIFFLNLYSKDHKTFQEVMEKPLGAGRAKPIVKGDFSIPVAEFMSGPDLCVHSGLSVNHAINLLNDLPPIEDFSRKFMIIGANVYTEEETSVAFVQEENDIIKQVKMGQLNRGFTFFSNENYSTRLLIKERKIQGLELYVSKADKAQSAPLEVKVPIFYEQKFNEIGKIDDLIKGFQIPDQLPDEEENEAVAENNNSS